MMNKLISVSLAVKNKVIHGSNWISACSLLLMLGLLAMCRPHNEVAKTWTAKTNLVKVTPYPVSVKLHPDSILQISPFYSVVFHVRNWKKKASTASPNIGETT